MVQCVPRHDRVGRLALVFVGEEARLDCLYSTLSHLRHHQFGYVHGHDALNMRCDCHGKCSRTCAEVDYRARYPDPPRLEFRDIFAPVGR
jgi:hypothetical protein